EFIDEARDALDQMDWEFPEDIRVVDTKEYGKQDISAQTKVTIQAEYEIDGFVLPTCNYTTFEWKVKSRDESRRQQRTIDCDIPISEFFDKLAPMLFLLHGLEYRLEINQESLELINL
ncbi:MAG: hypothetical protein ABEI86_10980, partial [Halobacteriaceae archaeon]